MIAALIPARGGSKGVPRKNVRMLGGKPLIVHTIEAAFGAGCLDGIFVSSEESGILEIAAAAGSRVIERPVELATDEAAALPVIRHALPIMDEALGGRVEILVYLQATTPFRTAADIDATVALLADPLADSAVSVVELTHSNPLKLKKIADGRLLPYSDEEPEGLRRQDLPAVYVRNGGVYASRRDTIEMLDSLYGRNCRAHIMPEVRSVEIDTETDFAFAEFLIARGCGELKLKL
ncbi:MAG: cytidylyltransferase domain-containing protein [Chthoniobacterales bacterium]